jgi:hypothetical protein
VLYNIRVSITSMARRNVGRFLSFFNGGNAIFAAEAKCAAVKDKYVAQMHTGRYEAMVPVVGDDSTDFECIELDYWWVCPYEAALMKLKSIRANRPATRLGMFLGETRGYGLGMLHLGDHGGEAFRWLTTFLFHDECRQEDVLHTGSIPHKESRDILAGTTAQHLDEGIGRLNDTVCLVVEWQDNFDFVFMDQSHCSCHDCVDDRGLPISLRTSFSEESGTFCVTCAPLVTEEANQLPVPAAVYTFERTDIPREATLLTFKALRFHPFLGGDLKHQFMCLGRDGHSSCKCARCSWNTSVDTKYGQEYVGVLWTQEGMEEEVKDYLIANAPSRPEGMSAQGWANLKKKSKAACAISGLKGAG